MLNGLDLFSGGGGLSEALEEWVRPVVYCENDRYAQGVLLSRMARGELFAGPIWDDVRTLWGTMLPAVDIIVAGFPCQDISYAGAQAGLDGERSGLFFEIIRLVRELRPQFIFLENVPGVVPFLGRVTGAMAALRYDCRWGLLSAADVGAPHLRERWFCLAHAIGDQRNERHGKFHKLRNAKTTNGSRGVGQANADRKGLEGTGYPFDAWESFPEPRPESIERWPHGIPQPTIRRGDDGMDHRSHALRVLGNGVVPAQAREAFKRLAGIGG